MRTKAILSMSVFIASCAYTGWDTTRVPANLRASQFNSITNEYHIRPTFVELTTFKSGKDYLAVAMDEYGRSINEIRFVDDNVDKYITMINKYLEWEKMATGSGDVFEKKIGSAGGFANSINFTFFSGNQYSHYLVLDTVGANEQFYNRANALSLIALLENYRDGEIRQKDIDHKYR